MGAALFFLLREEAPAPAKPVTTAARSASPPKASARGAPLKVDEVTKEQVQQILNEIVDSQGKMRSQMKLLTKEMRSKAMTFDETYRRVQAVQPEDPLEKCGLSMQDFDQLLNKHQNDPLVRQGIARIMGGPAHDAEAAPGAASADTKTLVRVHRKMLEELEKIVTKFDGTPGKDQYDMKTVTLAAQAVVGAKVEEEFGLSSEDIERAVMQNHAELATDQDFANINVRMQASMSKLLEA